MPGKASTQANHKYQIQMKVQMKVQMKIQNLKQAEGTNEDTESKSSNYKGTLRPKSLNFKYVYYNLD